MSLSVGDQFAGLNAELFNDPEGFGYLAMTTQQKKDSLEAVTRELPIDTVSSAKLYEAIVKNERDVLTPDQKDEIGLILSLGEGIPVRNSQVRTVLLTSFVAGTTTRGNLAELTSRAVNRLEELGLPPRVRLVDIERAENWA